MPFLVFFLSVMSERFSFIGFFPASALLCLVLVACAEDSLPTGRQSMRLTPCTAVGSPFASLDLMEWPAYYHDTVADVVDAHLRQMGDITHASLQCTASETVQVEDATDELRAVARSLPAWKARADSLSQSELTPVLLEFLRIYECSLNEWRDERWAKSLSGADMGARSVRMLAENQLIEYELTIAHPILERTLLIVAGFDRLRPLAYGTECLKRTSLDLRNVLGLAAEATACLPRTWDARGSLRDLTD